MDFDAALDTLLSVTAPVDLRAGAPPSADFPLAEHGLRHARLAALMEAEELDALVLVSEESIRYLSGYNSMIWAAAARWLPGALVVTRDPAAIRLVVSIFDAGAARGTAWTEVDPYGDATELPAKVHEHLRRVAARRVGLETGVGSSLSLPYELLRQLVDGLDPAGDASRLLSAMRMVKSPAEIERLRTAAQAAVHGYAAGLGAARAGQTEEELLSAIGAAMYANGCTASTHALFLNAVAGRDRAPLADAPGSERPLRNGDVVFVDGGGPCRGYMSDIIRMAAVGEVGAKAERWMEAALAANEALRESARAGTTVSELYEAGRDVYDEFGLGDAAGSLFGHGIGLEVWERPFVKRHDDDREDVTLRPGMTICLEPIVAPVEDGELAGLFVVEDMVAITHGDAEVLSDGLPREFARIPA
jgi:Xaa-Pro aminopeptidase